MASTSFIINEFTGSDAQVRITLDDIATNTVQVKLDVVSGYIADTVGFFADFTGLTVNNNFSITPVAASPGPALTVGTSPAAGILFLDDSGSTIDNSEVLNSNVNLNGGGVTRDYDLGVQIGVGGIGSEDDYNSVTFNLTAAGLDVSDFSKVGVRLQSVGEDRNGSSKLEGVPTGSTPTPSVVIDKLTNGADGLNILAGSDITWTYKITNTGNVTLSNVNVTDDKGVLPVYDSGDDGDGIFEAGESWIYKATDKAIAGAYTNLGTVKGNYNGTPVTANDPSNYFGAAPTIDVEKLVSVDNGATWVDADTPTGPSLLQNFAAPQFKFVVTNTGNVALSDVTLEDNKFALNGLTGDPIPNNSTYDIGALAVGGTKDVLLTGTTWQAGQHTNTATTKGSYTDDLGKTSSPTDNDDANYFGADPKIALNKVTNGADNQNILAGTPITWTYTVTNTGNVPVSGVSVSDNDPTVVPVYKSGDTNTDGVLDLNETWSYEAAGTAKTGAYSNLGTVEGSFKDTPGNTKPVNATDPSNYFGANPGIAIDKVTDNTSVQGDGLLIQEGSAISWIYTVTNTGNVGLSNVTVTDNKGVIPVGVDSNNDTFIDGDLNKDNILDLTETWVYRANGTSILGSYENTGTVIGKYTDSLTNSKEVTDADDSSYFGVKSPGARTPGFWQRWTSVWDGTKSNDSTFQGRAGFPLSDILLSPYTAATTDPITGQKALGVLVGDFNRNGLTDGSEKTVFYSLKEAQDLVNADKKAQQDTRYTLGRSLVASWLNFLAGNSAPTSDINSGITWLQQNTPDENVPVNGIGDGNLTLQASAYAVPASSSAWSGVGGGETINAALDYYNNTGLFGSQPI